MEQSMLRQAACSSLLLMCLVVILSVVVTEYRKSPDYALAMNGVKESASENLVSEEQESGLWMSEEEILAGLGAHYLIIPKLSKGSASPVIAEDPIYRSISIMVDDDLNDKWNTDVVKRVSNGMKYDGIPNGETNSYQNDWSLEWCELEEEDGEYNEESDEENVEDYDEEFDEENVEEFDEEELEGYDEAYDGEIAGESDPDPLTDIRIGYDPETGYASMTLSLDHVYVPVLYEDAEFYYIDLKRPQEVYEKILVVDAGHGGEQTGISLNGDTVSEKEMNLSIVSFLAELLAEQEDWKVYYTRREDESVYLQPRIDLANDVDADLFLSVHQNAYWNPYAYGTEVFYGQGGFSEVFASYCLETVSGMLGLRNRGLYEGSDTYLIMQSKVPTALIKVGYLTNPDDQGKLLQDSNLALAAEAIYRSLLDAFAWDGSDRRIDPEDGKWEEKER